MRYINEMVETELSKWTSSVYKTQGSGEEWKGKKRLEEENYNTRE